MEARMSWLILLQVSSVLVHGYDNVGFDGWYQPVPHRPVDIITDVINDLGVRILQQYTAHGNVAFSPTGVAFVLAALYEGSAGRGRQQIADALGLPRDRQITRIGFRDIHRRLRTYLNANGFLGGLTLNQENTKLRPEYEDILRFYGFDLSIPEEEMNETTSVPETTTNSMTEQTMTETVPDETTMVMTSQQGSETPISTTPSVEVFGMTMNTEDVQDRFTQTTPSGTTLTDVTSGTTVPGPTMTPSEETTTIVPEVPTTIPPDDSSTTTVNTVQPTTVRSSTPTTSPSTMMEGDSGSTSVGSQTTDSPITSTGSDSGVTEPMPESTTTSATTSTTIGTSTVSITTVMESTTSSTIPTQTGSPAVDANTVSTGSSSNQSVSNEMGSTDSPVTTAISTGETGSNEQSTTVPSTMSGTINRRKRNIRGPRGFFSSYPDEGIWMQDLGIWKPYSTSLNEASVRDSTEISFLVNGCDVSSVTATRYIAVLPFAYFPSLHAVALEFPLDDPRYNILLMMATDRRDTYRLARDLGGKSLRLLRKQLQATWVRATIPSFMLRGFVTLTSFLQRLGILDVFEPRAADLSPMTPDLGVYARDVQQSIGVNIRNYMKPDRTHSRESTNSDLRLIVPPRRDYYRYYHPGNGLFERAGPVPFTVVHPYLYFIVDAETSVTLIAGRVNDPLNSRIL
ncbi:flocculation protein FLO11-like isoform X1 [Osmia bicornis bicornis]|uniref:flocculation protein FLO11-like isoform X1 n=1 Tax=Osmia bicornis bicornis TaxID=1437191 RepID=UPI001EAF2AC0|nr:flocculation protein FLO11-like isoform X1 [Osmia bicornis bicornis]